MSSAAPSSPPRTLVLGATGHLGQALTRALLHAGHRVTVATRRARPPGMDDLLGLVDVVRGDLDDEGTAARWVAGHALVVDAAAPYALHLFAEDHRALFARARRRTAALAEAARVEGATLAFVSSFTTLPRPEEGAVRAAEARWRRRAHPYFALKQMMEDVVLEAAGRGLRALVVNPGACLGPWDLKPDALSLVGLIATGRFTFTVSDRVVNVIDVRDLADCVVAASARGPFGAPMPLAGHDVRFAELTARIARASGRRDPALEVPSRFGTVASLWIETAWAAAGRPSPMPTLGSLLIADGFSMRPTAAQRALEVALRPLDESVRDAVRWRAGCFPAARGAGIG